MALRRPGDPYSALNTGLPYAFEVRRPVERLRFSILDSNVDVFGHQIDADVLRVMANVGQVLADAGHEVQQGHPSAWFNCLDVWRNDYLPAVCAWVAHEIDGFAAQSGQPPLADDLTPHSWKMVERGRSLSARDYIAATEKVHRWARGVERWWSDCDILITPTVPFPARPNDDHVGENADMTNAQASSFTVQSNMTGQPAMSVPLGMSKAGLPIGIQFIAADGREDVLYRLAAFLEEAMPWSERIPHLHG
jgi:amidase